MIAAGLAAAAAPSLSERGKLLFSDDFTSAKPGWTAKPGKWEIVDGAAKITELPADKHAAVRRHALAYTDAIFEFSFKFDGAKQISLSINDKGGHVCRLIVARTGMILQRDKPNAKSDVKPARLAASQQPVSDGEWHKVVVEVKGPRMIAVLDGKVSISGTDPAIGVEKIDFGFPVTGQSAWLDNVKIYEVRGK
jgi:hypothetical protein